MTLSIPDRVVVFDYGEVISLSQSESDRAAIVKIAGCDADALWESYWRHRDGLDQGTVSIPDYWRAVQADVGASWSLSTMHALWVADFRSWWSVEPGTLDLIERLHDGGTRLAILSNAGFDFSARSAARRWPPSSSACS